MPVYKDKKRKYWYFIVTHNRKQYKKVLYNGHYMLSKTEAQQCEAEFVKNLIGYGANEVRIVDLYHEYLKASKTTLKASTQLNYEKFERNYLIFLENKKIHELTPHDILNWKTRLSNCDVSVEYKNRLQHIMKDLLNYGSIMYNLNGRLQYSLLQPFKDNEVKDIEVKTKYLQIDDFKQLIKPLEPTDYYYVIIWTLYFTGLRIGELAALQTKDITPEFISINKDYSRVKGKDIIQAPKNRNSIRKVPLDPVTSSMLQEFIKDKKPDEIVFRKEARYLNQQKLRRKINVLQAMAGLENLYITPHTLRHSYSSNLKKLGYDAYTISEIMGNTPEVASSTYIHTTLNYSEFSEKLKNLK